MSKTITLHLTVYFSEENLSTRSYLNRTKSAKKVTDKKHSYIKIRLSGIVIALYNIYIALYNLIEA